jgi:hypothetical protein
MTSPRARRLDARPISEKIIGGMTGMAAASGTVDEKVRGCLAEHRDRCG